MSEIYRVSDIPDLENDKELHNIMTSPKLRVIMGLLITNEIRKYNPESINDQQCRTQLAKIKALQDVIDFSLIQSDPVSEDITY